MRILPRALRGWSDAVFWPFAFALQVMGAGLTYAEMYQDEVAFKVAAVTKLMRNAFLAAVIPLLTYLNARDTAIAAGGRWRLY